MSLKEILEVNEINRESPIGLWKSLIETPDLMREELSEGLRYISAQYPPDAAEIVMNAACQFDCHHCIYPKDYPKFNKNLELRVWKEIFKGLYERLGFRTFVFGGRGLNKNTLEAVEYLKGFDDTKVGFIADGPQMERFLSQILESPADWIDVSVDGMAEQHDTQRKSPGSFYRSVEVLEKLLGYGRTPMVAILSTITTINQESLLEMVEYLNKIGLSNFHITPVGILDNYRPSPNLRPSQDDFNNLIDEFKREYQNLRDSFIMFHIASGRYIRYLKDGKPEMYHTMKADGKQLLWSEELNNNEFHVSITPSSLTASREFIINSNGDVITAEVVGMGKIPDQYIFGDAHQMMATYKNRDRFFRHYVQLPVFDFYIGKLMQERGILRS